MDNSTITGEPSEAVLIRAHVAFGTMPDDHALAAKVQAQIRADDVAFVQRQREQALDNRAYHEALNERGTPRQEWSDIIASIPAPTAEEQALYDDMLAYHRNPPGARLFVG
jgi:hypothetical protein